jgi:nucleoside-diphosphate-sugar epimerase
MRVLITGDQGFVGRAFHRYFATHRPEDDIVGCDLKNGSDARVFFRRNNGRYDLAIHLAAIVGGRQTIESDPLHVATDLALDADFFNWAARTRPRRLVYFSSSAAYPIRLQQRDAAIRALVEEDINLESPALPDFTYGWAKLTGEHLAEYASAHYGITTHVFRPFSGYGADQDLDYPFPSFVRRAREKQYPFEIWGDGTQVRDFVHIDDVPPAVFAAINEDYRAPLNICTGRPTTFNELAGMMAPHTPIRHLTSKPQGPHTRVGDPTNLNLVYTPRISLEEGIQEALNA